ncbi:enoyl-CoA hydratase/isomerase family protein [Octadecabacter arcticus]|uniref:enoyl-CoA hydratase/isomerase family protein n=1 Tax=Octadecabacter arcticus TaxID=53946 RepID=UPI00068763D9|nr:enoyl-CoA hydratase/isomerase family protein [Octadecabacter arcticus]
MTNNTQTPDLTITPRLVRFRVLEGVGVVTLDAEPVNTLSAPLRAGLWEAFIRIDANPDIKAVVLIASGRMFSAGVDIREFGKPAKQPSLAQLCDRIESCTKPVVAAFLWFGAWWGGLNCCWRRITVWRHRTQRSACLK